MKLKAFFIIFKGLSLEQIKQFFMFFMEGENFKKSRYAHAQY